VAICVGKTGESKQSGLPTAKGLTPRLFYQNAPGQPLKSAQAPPGVKKRQIVGGASR
jgi:hypothetical protein